MSTIVGRRDNIIRISDFDDATDQTKDSGEFDRQLQDARELFMGFKHERICYVLKELISMSDYSQIQSLWTAFQPLLHRDYMFMGQKVSPEYPLTPISTSMSRDIRSHLIRTRAISRFHRVQSAHIKNEHDVLNYNKLPSIHVTNSVVAVQKCNVSGVKRRKKKQLANKFGVVKSDDTNEKLEKFMDLYRSWSKPKRIIFFRHMLTILSPKQLYFICTHLSVKQSCDIVGRLPRDLSVKILSYLTPKELARSSVVSKRWYDLCLSRGLWQDNCLQVQREIATPSLKYFSGDWYDVYRKNEIRKQNWRNAKCSHVHLEGHSKKVLSVALNGKMLISGGADCNIRIWNIESGTLIKTLTGHTKGVWSLVVFTNTLVISGSHDNTIKVWNVKDGICLRTLLGHTGAVWTMSCKQHFLVSGSHDKLIKLWDLRKCSLIKTFKGHGSAVFAVELSDDDKFIFSGSADHSVRIWNISEGKCHRIIWTANSSPVMSISSQKGLMAYVAGNNLTLYDIYQDTALKTYKGHKCRIETVKLTVKSKSHRDEVNAITGGRDGRVRHWTLTEGEHNVKTMYVHPHQVNCITFDKKRILTALCDNTICLCDFTVTEEVEESRATS